MLHILKKTVYVGDRIDAKKGDSHAFSGWITDSVFRNNTWFCHGVFFEKGNE